MSAPRSRATRRARRVIALLLAAALPLVHAARQEPVLRFTALDVWLDPLGEPLAAWQVELVDRSGRARVVGVEGGDGPSFAAPPYYDPAALAGGRIVLAAFDTRRALPSARTRVARIHVAVRGAARASFDVALEAAAAPDGRTIECHATVQEREER